MPIGRHLFRPPSRATTLVALAILGAVPLVACGGSSSGSTSANGAAASAPPALTATATSTRAPASSTAGHAAATPSKPPTSVSGAAPAGGTTTSTAAANAHPNSPPAGGVNVPTNAGTGTPLHKARHPAQRFGAKVRKADTEFARCMRAHGINLPEPNFSGGPVYGKTHVNTNAPGFAAAAMICRAQIVASASG